MRWRERALRERARPRTASHKQQREYDIAKPMTHVRAFPEPQRGRLLDVVVPCGADLGSIRSLGRRRPVTCLYRPIECGERMDDLHCTDIEDHVEQGDLDSRRKIVEVLRITFRLPVDVRELRMEVADVAVSQRINVGGFHDELRVGFYHDAL